MKMLIKLAWVTGQNRKFGALVNAYSYAHGSQATRKLLTQMNVRAKRRKTTRFHSEYMV